MRHRWLAALGLGLAAGPAAAAPPAPYQSLSAFEVAAPPAAPADCDRPAVLPPLLPVPPAAATPAPAGPRGPVGEYDHGHLYLPERAPDVVRPPREACGPGGRFWFAPSLEHGRTKAADAPPLVRLGTATGPAVYGDERLRTPTRGGLGLAGGVWLDAAHTHGFDAGFYYLAEGGNRAAVLSNTVPLILPTADGRGFPLADPARGYSAGAYQVGLNTRFASADVNYRERLLCGPNGRLDGLVGYRYGHVGEDFTAFGKRLGPGGEVVRFRDDVEATNHFHGGQVGLAGEAWAGRWFLGATGKVAFGTVFTDTELNGKFRVNGAVPAVGFYARPGLNGPRDATHTAVMPTTALTFGRQLGDHARVFVGYNFLYLSTVTRGTDVIDPTPPVGPDPHAVLPVANNRRDASTSDFWAQSLSLGMEWRY